MWANVNLRANVMLLFPWSRWVAMLMAIACWITGLGSAHAQDVKRSSAPVPAAPLPTLQQSGGRVLDDPAPKERTLSKVRMLNRAHAHNDYLHARPLLDALDHGFESVEADVFLIDGVLLVAHSRLELKRKATLETLYLKPLQQRIEAHQGSVYGDGQPLTLLIDFKADGARVYTELKRLLVKYPQLTAKTDPQAQPPVRIIVSGDRPIEMIEQDPDRQVGIDGRLSDLEKELPADLYPLISDNWTQHFQWKGTGPMPGGEQEKLQRLVEEAHRQGKRLRFWAIPDRLEAWRELDRAGVDLINTDHLDQLHRFLRASEL